MSINIEKLTERTTQESFPNIVISSPNETVPVVVRTLTKGDMQLIVEFNGKRKAVASISPSAFNVSKLLRTTGQFQYNVSQGISLSISSVEDYLSCL